VTEHALLTRNQRIVEIRRVNVVERSGMSINRRGTALPCPYNSKIIETD